MNIIKNNFIYISIYLFILMITSYLKLNNILTFDTNVDELLIPAAILENNDIESNNYYDFLTNFFRPILNVIKHSTYAPGQIIFIRILLYFTTSYSSILILSRLTSFLISILAINLISFIFVKSDKIYGNYKSILSLIILSFSWEFFIFSLQTHPYIINVLLTSILTYYILIKINSVYSYKEFIILSILPWFHYQILFFYPAFFIIRYYNVNKLLNYVNKKTTNIIFILIPFLSCFIIYFFLLKHYSNSGINYSSGINNEFIFNLPNLNFIEKFKYIYTFFISNGIKTIISMVLFVPESSLSYNIFKSIYIIFLILGILNFINLKKYSFIFFFIICVSTFILLIICKKIALSPTRHYLIFLSFFVIFITEGIYFIIIKLKKFIFITSILILGIIFSFLYTYNNEISNRYDPLSENLIIDLINKNKINFIIAYDNTLNLRFMKKIQIPILDCGGGVGSIYLNKIKKNNKPTKILLI